jgi:tetratricopeptide (TPR) repeat protein
MHLQAGLGASSIFLHGESAAARTALSRGVAIAEQRGDALNQIGLLSWLLTCHFRRGDFEAALLCARRSRAVAETIDDPAAMSSAHSMLGRTLHVMGDLEGARAELEASLQSWSRARHATVYLAHEFHFTSDITLARVLWLQGHAAEAAEHVDHAIEKLEDLENPALLVVALAWGVSVFLWAGDLERAETCIDRAITLAESNGMASFAAIGRARKAELAIQRGDARSGVETLRACLETIRAAGSESLTTEFNMALIQGLSALGQYDEALRRVDEVMRWVETGGHALYMPELLRIKGSILLATPQRSVEDAEACFTQSLALSRRQGAHAWELRTAADLAALR